MIKEARLRRKSIRRSVRAEVLSRDGLTCRYCGRAVVRGYGLPYRPDHLHLDHVIPWAHGGSDEADNLVVSCAACNLSRVRPATGAAACRLLWEVKDGEYYWRDRGYRPPRAITVYDPEALFTLEEAAEILSRPVVDVLVSIVDGRSVLRGTMGTSRPILVQFDTTLNDWIEERMDELGWES